MHGGRGLVVCPATHNRRKGIVEYMARMVHRHASGLCHQHEFVVFEHDLKIRRNFGLGVVRYVVHHLVAAMRNSFQIRSFAVYRHKAVRNLFAPQFATVVSKALAKRIEQQPAFMLRLHNAFKVHI